MNRDRARLADLGDWIELSKYADHFPRDLIDGGYWAFESSIFNVQEYVRGHAACHVHLMASPCGHLGPRQFCAEFRYLKGVGLAPKMFPQEAKDVEEVVTAPLDRLGKHGDWHQEPVFITVGVVPEAAEMKSALRSTVRLKLLDDCLVYAGQFGKPSAGVAGLPLFATTLEGGQLILNGKLKPALDFNLPIGVLTRELKDKVIEGATQTVADVTKDKGALLELGVRSGIPLT